MVLLCPTCNQARKGAQFSSSVLQSWLSNLSNLTNPESLFYEHAPVISLGDNMFFPMDGREHLVLQIGRNYLHLQHNRNSSCINAAFFNKAGELSLRISNSQYQFSTNAWDINYIRGDKTRKTPGVLTFQDGTKETFLKVRFDAEHNQIGVLGQFWPAQNCLISIRENGIFSGDNVLASKCLILNTKLAFWVRTDAQLFSTISTTSGIRNVANVDHCLIQEADIGFVWDLAFLHSIDKRNYLKRFTGFTLMGEPINDC